MSYTHLPSPRGSVIRGSSGVSSGTSAKTPCRLFEGRRTPDGASRMQWAGETRERGHMLFSPIQEFFDADLEDSLLFAAAGTGKTTALLRRAILLMVKTRIAAEDILLLTFTRYAREDLVRRLHSLLNERPSEALGALTDAERDDARELEGSIMTLAALTASISEGLPLHRGGHLSGTEEGEEDVLTRLTRDTRGDDAGEEFVLGASYREHRHEPAFFVRQHPEENPRSRRPKRSTAVSKFKLRYYRHFLEQQTWDVSTWPVHSEWKAGLPPFLLYLCAEYERDFAGLLRDFAEYEERLQALDRFDSTDLAALSLAACEDPTRELPGLRRRRAILVDEMQDLSPMELDLVWALKTRWGATLTMVGDVNQTLYYFRLASPLRFVTEPLSRFRAYSLETNRRSERRIVESGNRARPSVIPATDKGLRVWNGYLDGTMESFDKAPFHLLGAATIPDSSDGCLNYGLGKALLGAELVATSRRGAKEIAVLAYSKNDLLELREWARDALLDAGLSSCFWADLLSALKYTKIFLIQRVLKHGPIGGQEWADLVHKVLHEETGTFSRALEGDTARWLGEISKDLVKEVPAPEGGDVLADLRAIQRINVREVGLSFVGRIVREGVVLFINLHQIKGLQFDAVFYKKVPLNHRTKNAYDVTHEIQLRNLHYVASTRARRFHYEVV